MFCYKISRRKPLETKTYSCDRGGKNVNKVVEGAASDFESEPVYTMQDITAPSLMQRLKVNGEVLKFEIDAGSKK